MFEISLLAACESDFRQIFDVETNNSDESSSPWLRLLALSLVNTTNKMEREQKTLLLDNESLEETWNFLEFIFDGNLFDFKFAIWTNDANDCESFVVMMMILRLTINSLQREEEEKDIFSPLKFFFHSSIHSQVSRPFIKGDERKICANLFQLTSLQEFFFIFSSEKWKKGTYLGKIQSGDGVELEIYERKTRKFGTESDSSLDFLSTSQRSLAETIFHFSIMNYFQFSAQFDPFFPSQQFRWES